MIVVTLVAVLLINTIFAEVLAPDNLPEETRVNGDWDRLPLDRKVKVFQKLEEDSVLEELKDLLGNLDEDDLDNLEDILTENLDQVAEFKLMMDKLKDIGLEENHIQDIYNKAQLINEFLLQIPNISIRLGLDGDLDLLDHIQLYLLGLPNKLGPLGFIALRHILLESTESSDDSEDEIVDVIAEPFDLPSALVDAGGGAATVEETEDDNLKRTRRQAQISNDHQQALIAHQAAEIAVLRQQGLDPALLDHQQALQAHKAAENAVRAQHVPVVGPSGNIGSSGVVGPSGNIGPSGLCGPSGCIQFRKKRNTPSQYIQHQQALEAHKAAENQVLRQQGRDPALHNHQQALLAHQRAEEAVRAQQINAGAPVWGI